MVTTTRELHLLDRRVTFARLSIATCLLFGQSYANSQSQQFFNIHDPGASLISRIENIPKFALPVDCTLGKNCHVLAYMDRKPGPEFMDFGGGRQTYDEHDGTDFGIADETVMAKGVAVKAAAAGLVVRVRDGVVDKRVENPQQAAAIDKIGCGNAVVIDHSSEWRTYYCHLRNSSLTVTPGMRVEQGAVLGMVGMSGLASYPHVHFGVLYRGKKIDPFLELTATGTGDENGPGLWQEAIKYVPTGLVSAGFSSKKADIGAIWQGTVTITALTTTAPAIVFWVHPFGVLVGDVEQIRLIAPDGTMVLERKAVIKSSNRINWLSVIGQRNTPAKPLRLGTWKGEYQLWRNEKLLIDIKREIEVTPA